MSHGTQTGRIIYVPDGSVFDEHDFSLGVSICKDTIGNYPNPNGLDIEHRSVVSLGTATGRSPFFPVLDFQQWKLEGQDYFTHQPIFETPPSDSSISSDVLMRSNPSRPEVDVPVFVIESLQDGVRHIREVFQRSQERFDAIPEKDWSNRVATWNFSLKPLYRDLSKLFGYAEQLNRRTDELKRLYRPGGLRRRIPIWSAASSGSLGDMTVLSLDGAIVDVELLFHSRREIWGTAKWLPDNPLPPSDHDLVNTAKAAIHGWNISLSSIWELVPWSWMGDYFANIGDYLAVHRNNVGAHPSEV